MKLLVILAVAVTVAAAAEIYRGKPDLDKEWEGFKGRHGKRYKHSGEEAERRKLWEAKRERVNKHNQEAAAGKHTYTKTINHISDLKPEELKNLEGTVLPPEKPRIARKPAKSSAWTSNRVDVIERQVGSVDLRTDPCMPPIKNQNPCGACWAFSATTPVEWALCKKNNNQLILLSEQQLVDCSGSYGNNGCKGGFYTQTWSYIKDNGQTRSSVYPYIANNATCKYDKRQSVTSVMGYQQLPSEATESEIRAAIDKYGPVAAALKTVPGFFEYNNGVFSDDACPTDRKTVSHGVVLVGYGSLNGVDYWILRNSWNTTWGQNGYMLIRRGTNECNIEAFIAYPTYDEPVTDPSYDDTDSY